MKSYISKYIKPLSRAQKMQFFLMAILFSVAAIIDHVFNLHHTTVKVAGGIPIIGAQDMRIAYTNTYRTLLKKAMRGVPSGKTPPWMPNTDNRILSQSYLRSEIQLTATRSQYQFGINTNQIAAGQVLYPSEQRLNLQDSFFVSNVGYYFRNLSAAGGNLSSRLYTAPSGQFYGSGGVTALTTQDTLWDGNLSLAVNNRTIVPSWDLWRHFEQPNEQFPVFGSAIAGSQFPVDDEGYGSQSGMYPCEPMWILDGSYDSICNVTFNNSIATAIGSNTIHMVLILRGILAQNCGKIMEGGGLMEPNM